MIQFLDGVRPRANDFEQRHDLTVVNVFSLFN